MKKLFIILITGLLLTSAFTTEKLQPGITGTIEPADAVNKVWAINGNDSASVVPLNGRFTLNLKLGNWILFVEAINPYKNYSQSVLVLEGGPTDVGVIKLTK